MNMSARFEVQGTTMTRSALLKFCADFAGFEIIVMVETEGRARYNVDVDRTSSAGILIHARNTWKGGFGEGWTRTELGDS